MGIRRVSTIEQFMQTFLPFTDLTMSVQCLDYKRLGKQRVEALQIINSLANPNYGYKHHPVKLLWANHVDALKYYCNLCIQEWELRGYHNTMEYYALPEFVELPIFEPMLYVSHQSNLLRKDRPYYCKYFDGPSDIDYVWSEPVNAITIENILFRS